MLAPSMFTSPASTKTGSSVSESNACLKSLAWPLRSEVEITAFPSGVHASASLLYSLSVRRLSEAMRAPFASMSAMWTLSCQLCLVNVMVFPSAVSLSPNEL